MLFMYSIGLACVMQSINFDFQRGEDTELDMTGQDRLHFTRLNYENFAKLLFQHIVRLITEFRRTQHI